MTRYFGCDAHKRYSVFTSVDDTGSAGPFVRVENDRSLFRSYLRKMPRRSLIALETVGNWYWMVDEMEKSGQIPLLTHAGKAKAMMGQINKTDKLDAKGLALLLRNGTLPSIGRKLLKERLRDLPPQTGHSVAKQLELLDDVEDQIKESERQIKEVVQETPEMTLLMTLPGVGMILAIVMAMEVGDVNRFMGPDSLASHAGSTAYTCI